MVHPRPRAIFWRPRRGSMYAGRDVVQSSWTKSGTGTRNGVGLGASKGGFGLAIPLVALTELFSSLSSAEFELSLLEPTLLRFTVGVCKIVIALRLSKS